MTCENHLDERREQCSCTSHKGVGCPEPVAWAVNINYNEQWLCERCYQNVKSGAYPMIKLLAAIYVGDLIASRL